MIDINNTSEAQFILSTIGSAPGPAIIGNYSFASNVTGTTGTVDNGFTGSGNYTVGQLPLNPAAHFIIQYTAGIYFPEGDYSIYANGDDGHSITIPGVTFVNRFGQTSGVPDADELRYEDPTGSSNQGAQFSGFDAEWDILSENADGSGIAINSTPFDPVPEPNGIVLLILGSLVAAGKRRRST